MNNSNLEMIASWTMYSILEGDYTFTDAYTDAVDYCTESLEGEPAPTAEEVRAHLKNQLSSMSNQEHAELIRIALS
ncbi:hypothetical protein M2277_005085 [Paenibacillus sp. LBL]|uniref:hypothetical protein n=1 Tax=Paenibacillus sp. LBL TaxID=2940563 RepID=UPI002475F3A8|nr:hypothetical protein [Paenibacillus sp. LBL]MDH6674393.1 hypothetical protein [Paenibacillus sp. LBL]